MFYRNSQQKHIDFVTQVVINLKEAMLVNCWNYRQCFAAASPSRALWPRSSGRKRQSTAHTSRSSGREWDFIPTSRNPGGTSRGSDGSEDKRRSLPAWQKPVRTQRHNIFSQFGLEYAAFVGYLWRKTTKRNPETWQFWLSETCVKVSMQEPNPELTHEDKKLAWQCMCKWGLTLSFLPNYCLPLSNYIHTYLRVRCIKHNVENWTLNLYMHVWIQTICGTASLRRGLHLIGYLRAVILWAILLIIIIKFCPAFLMIHSTKRL